MLDAGITMQFALPQRMGMRTRWLIAGVGIGCLYQTPLLGLHAAMPVREQPTSTAAFTLFRTLGGTIGVSIANTIFASGLRRRAARIPGFPASSTASASIVTGDCSSLARIEPADREYRSWPARAPAQASHPAACAT